MMTASRVLGAGTGTGQVVVLVLVAPALGAAHIVAEIPSGGRFSDRARKKDSDMFLATGDGGGGAL